ncbi:MAG: GxxExxY protein [Planctomycetota bacterium]
MNSSGEREMIDEFFGGLKGTFLEGQLILGGSSGVFGFCTSAPAYTKDLDFHVRTSAAYLAGRLSHMRMPRAGIVVFYVPREVRRGQRETVHEVALAREPRDRGLTSERQVSVPIQYKGILCDEGFRADIIVGGKVIPQDNRRRRLSMECLRRDRESQHENPGGPSTRWG